MNIMILWIESDWTNAKQIFSPCGSHLVYLISLKTYCKKYIFERKCLLIITGISIDRYQRVWSPCTFVTVPYMVGPSHSEHWHQQGNIRKKSCTYPLLQQYPEGCKKLSALNIKKKECFHKAQTVCHILKEYRDSRLIMFSINCFIVLGNVSP